MSKRRILGAVLAATFLGGVAAQPVGENRARRMEFRPVFSAGDKWEVEVRRMGAAPSVPKERLKNWKPRELSLV